MTTERLAAGRDFIVREGRLLERRLLETVFDGASPAGVIDVLRGYRNADGGFGHGLEPDTRCPASLPIYVERALDALIAAGVSDEPMIATACDWLAVVAGPDGAVPLAFPVIEGYPRAEHWTEWTYVPGLNPTAGLAGRLRELGVDHAWLDRATKWCFTRLEARSDFDEDAHALGEVLDFLANAPDRDRAAVIAAGSPDGWPTCSGSEPTPWIPATARRRCTSRRRRTARGATSSTQPRSRGISTGSSAINRTMAAG